MRTLIRTIDAHAAGEPLRLVVDGFPSPRGRSMSEKRDWLKRHADHLRRALMLEPRGHADMYGAILTEPVSPGSHAGILFMHNAGYSAMCGHGVIAATTIALERGLLMPGGDGATVIYDTVVGTIRARASLGERRSVLDTRLDTREHGGASASGVGVPPSPGFGEPGRSESGGRGPHASEKGGAPRESKECRDPVHVKSVSYVSVPSFVLHGGLTVKVGSRQVRVDIAYGGEFYAIVDGEAVALPIDADHLPELRRVSTDIVGALDASHTIAHPLDPAMQGVGGTIFTGPPRGENADLRSATVFADGEVDRSPCGTGTAAVMAVIDAMGLLSADTPFVHESLIGTRFTGRLAGRTRVGEYDAILPEIAGSAWITGEHSFMLQDDDPLKKGFRL